MLQNTSELLHKSTLEWASGDEQKSVNDLQQQLPSMKHGLDASTRALAISMYMNLVLNFEGSGSQQLDAHLKQAKLLCDNRLKLKQTMLPPELPRSMDVGSTPPAIVSSDSFASASASAGAASADSSYKPPSRLAHSRRLKNKAVVNV